MDYQILWETALRFLESESNRELVRRELNDAASFGNIASPNRIYFSLLKSISSPSFKPRVIGDIRNFREITDDLNPYFVAKFSFDELARYLSEHHPLLIQRKRSVNPEYKTWYQFTRSMIEGAEWLIDALEKEGPSTALIESLRKKCDTPRHCITVAENIASRIFGLGLATALDFLMDIGLPQIGKPDRHTKEILAAAGLLSSTAACHDVDAFNVLWKIAQVNGTYTRCVDRVFWIIGSGKFQISETSLSSGSKDRFLGIIRQL